VTTLGDFSDDPVIDALGEEHGVWLQLSRWFAGHGADVFWEEMPEPAEERTAFSRFRMTGNDRPDLLVVGDQRTFAVEVKSGDSTGDVTSGAWQTRRYWHDYVTPDVETEYTVDGRAVDIDAFVLATGHSPDGAIYARWFDRTVRDWPAAKRWPGVNGPLPFTPRWEFAATESVTRLLWRAATEHLEQVDHDTDGHPGIGCILSGVLDWEDPPTRLPEDAVGPFERARGATIGPAALYKRPIINASNGFEPHNWRWVE
jgi:hypothetical protein